MTNAKLFPVLLSLLAGACSPTSRTALDGDDDTGSTSQEIGATAKRWPSSTIYYYIDLNGHHADTSQPGCDMALPESLSSEDLDGNGVADVKDDILEAFARYEAQSPLRFVPLGHVPTAADNKAVMFFTRGDYDNPHAGGTPSTSDDNYQGCVYLPEGDSKPQTVQHEIGHDLGMMHEQRRSDRDSYVTYDASCVAPDHDQAFAVITTSENLTPYDLESIMQYSSTSFCDKDRPECYDAATDFCKKPPLLIKGCNDPANPACLIGKHTDFSSSDINALYRMYEPVLGNDEANDLHGAAMAAGDFDGDGYDDLAVGAPGEDPGTGKTTGAILLYKGTEGGLVTWKLLRESDFSGAVLGSTDRFGAALAAGDFDGDGDADLMVGAPGYNGTGAVFRFNGHHLLGERTGPTPGFIITDPSPSTGGNGFGSAVALGKVDGTHMALVVGAPSAAKYSVRNGMAFYKVENGAWKSLSADSGGQITYAAGFNFGSSIGIGNLTGPNSGGLVIGAPANTGAGHAFIYTGGATQTLVKNITATSPTSGDRYGKAIAVGRFYISPAVDLVAVGAPGAANGGSVSIDYVTSATTTSRLETVTEGDAGLAEESEDQFGAALAAGDISWAGRATLVIGAPGEDAGKGLVVFDMPSGYQSRTEQDDGFTRQGGDHFGAAIAIGKFGDAADDPAVKNDLFGDIAVGSPNRAPKGIANAGTVQEFFGRISGGPIFEAGFDQEAASPE